jgi:regulation of enolase protein 1 (concanavalin A-like superfamily)
MHYYYLLMLACFPFALCAAQVKKEDDAAKLERAYGAWTDADKDCKYVLKDGELRVSLPAAWHIMWKQRRGAKNNAPRVLREVEGDFTAVVRVKFQVPKSVPEEHWPYCSGGLVAWESEKEHLVIRRCGGAVNGYPEAVWSHHVTTAGTTDSVLELDKPAESAFLRLKREGKKAIVGWSRDGKAWKEFEPADVAWGAKVKVGVVAENCLDVPMEITFDQYSLTQPKK